MKKQNITLALPTTLLRRGKLLAVERETSVSALMVDLLAGFISREGRYAGAKRRALERLGRPADLGTAGRASWSREELHGR